jgi:hypothetical protein
VFFQEFGEHGILALQLAFEILDFLVLGILGGFGLAAVVEGDMAVLEELLEPAVELVGVKIILVTEVGNGDPIDEMPLEDSNLLGAGKMTPRAHGKPPVGLT